MVNNAMHIVQVGDVLVSPDIFTEFFCCDLSACHGACCVEGDAGAPVTLGEIAEIEECLDDVWADLPASAQSAIDRQGVAYADSQGDLVTTIVAGKDCAFSFHMDGCCLCALEKACREGRTGFLKPVSCSLYPIREKTLTGGAAALNYHRWDICRPAVELGRRKGLRVFQFLEGPLTARFGAEWYAELCLTFGELQRQGLL